MTHISPADTADDPVIDLVADEEAAVADRSDDVPDEVDVADWLDMAPVDDDDTDRRD
jgi:hypothetical protein